MEPHFTVNVYECTSKTHGAAILREWKGEHYALIHPRLKSQCVIVPRSDLVSVRKMGGRKVEMSLGDTKFKH